jgi:hypothetical protein
MFMQVIDGVSGYLRLGLSVTQSPLKRQPINRAKCQKTRNFLARDLFFFVVLYNPKSLQAGFRAGINPGYCCLGRAQSPDNKGL